MPIDLASITNCKRNPFVAKKDSSSRIFRLNWRPSIANQPKRHAYFQIRSNCPVDGYRRACGLCAAARPRHWVKIVLQASACLNTLHPAAG